LFALADRDPISADWMCEEFAAASSQGEAGAHNRGFGQRKVSYRQKAVAYADRGPGFLQPDGLNSATLQAV
jgi:hypothetical protein